MLFGTPSILVALVLVTAALGKLEAQHHPHKHGEVTQKDSKQRKNHHTHSRGQPLHPNVVEALRHAEAHHQRYFPDWQYEGFATEAEAVQPQQNVRRRGTGPHDVSDATPTMNPHMANTSLPYPANLLWLLNIFETGFGLPRSYNDVLPNGQTYWATKTYLEVGAFDENGHSTPLDSLIAIQERTLTRFGLNLYDAATWEIALALWGRYDVAKVYESNILYAGTTGPAGNAAGSPGGITDIRADSSDFKYGNNRVLGSALKSITYPANVTHFPSTKGKPGSPVKSGPGAFFYRMIGPHYKMADPMSGSYGQAWKYPWPNDDSTTTWNTFGVIHFNDWKPITGENVWGAMLGPLQGVGLATNNNLTNASCGSHFLAHPLPCDFSTFENTPAQVQLGISILPALLALQAPQGALFHCPWGAKIFPPDPEEGENVSNENNFSAFASLEIFYAVLFNYTKGNPSDPVLNWALESAKKLRDGLDKWFDLDSMLSGAGELPDNARVVPQGGHINASGYVPVPISTVGGLAVDCQTWGMTVLGQPRFDAKWGLGTAYNVWQTAKKYAGFYKKNGTVLAGVGYTDVAKDGKIVGVHNIWSAEWTFGAINMAQVLSQQYSDAGKADWAADLLADAQSMWNEVVKPWPEGLQFPDGSYVYANKRFFIPWGWFANPISAMCSTAWSVMMDRNCDPFHWGCGNKPLLKPPYSYTQ